MFMSAKNANLSIILRNKLIALEVVGTALPTQMVKKSLEQDKMYFMKSSDLYVFG
jgi:hypothetical protein